VEPDEENVLPEPTESCHRDRDMVYSLSRAGMACEGIIVPDSGLDAATRSNFRSP
jgi:hypothetical protein